MSEQNKKELLNKGFVRLIDHMGSDLSVVRAARNSYDAAWRAGYDEKGDSKLIHYLMKNRHTTPFEAATVTFEVKAPIFVFRQWHRHRTQSFNEMSARYAELPSEFYIPDLDKIGAQSKSSKQARTFRTEDAFDYALNQSRDQYITQCQNSYQTYQFLLNRGWPRELARCVLPLSMYSKMFMTVNLHNLFHFLTLRIHAHAQYEIRVYAEAMLEFLKPLFPVSVEAYLKYRDVSKSLQDEIERLTTELKNLKETYKIK